jgi:hypothetical protein
VTAPRFAPKSFCVDPKRFGRFEDPGWVDSREYSSDTLDQFMASGMQNKVAVAMRSAIKAKYRTADRYADAVGIDLTRLGRLLCGTVVMRLEDVANARRNLGVQL